MNHQYLAQAYAMARQKLGPESHSRLHKAFDLALDGHVEMLGPVNAIVHSADKHYPVSCSSCDCIDFKVERAPHGKCKHILAMCLVVRAARLETEHARTHEATPTPPLPEAAISICMKGQLAGMPGTMITLRGATMDDIEARAAEVKARLHHAVTGLFDAPSLRQGLDQARPADNAPFVPPAVAHLYE